MGNCLFGGLGEEDVEVIKVVTSNGGVMEFQPPVIVECITDRFPGHGIFRCHDLFWQPLLHHEELSSGESYYLLPLNNDKLGGRSSSSSSTICDGQAFVVRQRHVRSNSIPTKTTLLFAPYRMSLSSRGMLKRSYTEVSSRNNNHVNGNSAAFWKVKLVICPQQLTEILSQEARTEELIESVRTVAKCGNGAASSVGFLDQWSLSSSRNASSKKDGALELI